MSRSTWKGPFTDLIQKPGKEMKKIKGGAQTLQQPPKIWSRRSQILPMNVGKEFLVHNGRAFISVKCTESMCSRKWGEFAVTRKRPFHKINKKKQLHKR